MRGRAALRRGRRVLTALAVTALAGAATVLGGLLGVQTRLITRRGALAAALAFAAGAMVLVSMLEVLPKGAAALAEGRGSGTGWVLTGLLALTGALVVVGLRWLVERRIGHGDPDSGSAGAESAGHRHGGGCASGVSGGVAGEGYGLGRDAGSLRLRTGLWRSGLLVALAVGAHNLPEGLITFSATLADPAVGIVLAIAVAVHNVPEGMAVAVPVYAATGSRRRALGMTALSGMAEPVGGLLGFLALRAALPGENLALAFPVVGGMMLLISLQQLLPMALASGRRRDVVLGMGAGASVMALSLGMLRFA